MSTLIVLNNVRFNHDIGVEILDRWPIATGTTMIYLSPYRLELNLIEILRNKFE